MLGYLYANAIYMFWEESEKQTVSYEEQKTKDKYPRIFSPQMKAIAFIILQIAVLKIVE